jgi:O-antigen ligase
MLISGTRGAFAIPVIGIFVYLLIIKNFKIIIIGTSILFIVFFILKFTFIGQGNYEIQRLRSSLNPNDPSLQVRIENQKKLGIYLQQHWLGGGVGSGGYWGQRFSPNTFLAKLALDSWYVRIAAEYGYPGLLFYISMLIYIIVQGIKKIRSETNKLLKNELIGVFCGLCGVLVASYTNQVFGQMPTGIIIYLSIVFLTLKETKPLISNESSL